MRDHAQLPAAATEKWDVYTAFMLLHLLALPIMLFGRDLLMKALVFIYVINDGIYHVHWVVPESRRSNCFYDYHFTVINLLMFYVVTRLLLAAHLSWKWVFALLLVISYGMLTSNNMPAPPLHHEWLVHIYQWTGLLLILFFLVPSINQPLKAPKTLRQQAIVGLGIVLLFVPSINQNAPKTLRQQAMVGLGIVLFAALQSRTR